MGKKKDKDESKELIYEIGLFVVEFEKLQKSVKELIVNCFKSEDLNDINLIEIVLYQSTAYQLTEYFRGIILYQVSKMEIKYVSEEEKRKLDILKKYIKIANDNLQEVATFRNDLLHASYENTTAINMKDDKFEILREFQGVRSKIKSSGIELNHVNIKPNVFKKITDMMMVLKFLVEHIDLLINKDHFKTFNFNDDAFKLYSNEINIKAERNKLFEANENYYLKQYTFRRDMKAREEYYLGVQNGTIPGGG
jgi:hypothetical protein